MFEPNYPNKETVPHFYNQLNVNVHLLGFVSYCITLCTLVFSSPFTRAPHSLRELSFNSRGKKCNIGQPWREHILAMFCRKNRNYSLLLAYNYPWSKKYRESWRLEFTSGCASKSISRRNWDKSFNCPSICSGIVSTDFRHSTHNVHENRSIFFHLEGSFFWSIEVRPNFFSPVPCSKMIPAFSVHLSFCTDRAMLTIKAS